MRVNTMYVFKVTNDIKANVILEREDAELILNIYLCRDHFGDKKFVVGMPWNNEETPHTRKEIDEYIFLLHDAGYFDHDIAKLYELE